MAYHVNMETGEVNLCRARLHCPFGPPSEHRASAADARAQFERMMETDWRPLSSLLSPRGSTLRAVDELNKFTQLSYDEAEEFKNRLTSEEASSLHQYSMGSYEFINAGLRFLTHTHWGEKIEDWRVKLGREHVENMDRMFARLTPTGPRVVYRYIGAEHMLNETMSIPDAVRKMVENGIYEEQAYMSTSLLAEFSAYQTAMNKDTRFLLEIATDRGVPLQADHEARRGDIQSQEHEILLPRDGRFEIAGFEMRKRVETGDLTALMLPPEWKDNAVTRRIRRTMHLTVPVVKLVHV